MTNENNEKIVLELGKITDKMKIKLTLNFDVGSGENSRYNSSPIKLTTWRGTNYFKLAPRPLVSFDINLEKGVATNFYLTKFTLSTLVCDLEDFLDDFKNKELFYNNNVGELCVDRVMQTQFTKFTNASNKQLCFIPSTIRVRDDGGTGEHIYEGCHLCINSREDYTELTYSELRFLLYTLKRIDLDMWGVQMLNAYRLHRDGLESHEVENTMVIKEESLPSGVGYNISMNSPTIPKLN